MVVEQLLDLGLSECQISDVGEGGKINESNCNDLDHGADLGIAAHVVGIRAEGCPGDHVLGCVTYAGDHGGRHAEKDAGDEADGGDDQGLGLHREGKRKYKRSLRCVSQCHYSSDKKIFQECLRGKIDGGGFKEYFEIDRRGVRSAEAGVKHIADDGRQRVGKGHHAYQQGIGDHFAADYCESAACAGER